MILREEYGSDAPEMFGYGFEQIDDVFGLVQQWCKDHDDIGFSLRFTRHGSYIATIQNESIVPAEIIAESQEFQSATYVMLWACLAADRKLRERS